MKTPEIKQGPEKLFIDYYEFETGDTSGGWYDHNYNNEDFVYIRKDIVLDMMEQSVVKGFEHAVKGNNLFTKEQVVKMIFDFQFDFFSSVDPEFVDETEIIKYAEEFFSKNKAI